MQYRTHDDGPLTTIELIRGAVVVTMEYDLPGCFTCLHDHEFDHWMECVVGPARIVIDDVESIVQTGDRYLVEAHKRHGVWALAEGVMLRCIHNNADIYPDRVEKGSIPMEWLDRLTNGSEHALG